MFEKAPKKTPKDLDGPIETITNNGRTRAYRFFGKIAYRFFGKNAYRFFSIFESSAPENVGWLLSLILLQKSLKNQWIYMIT